MIIPHSVERRYEVALMDWRRVQSEADSVLSDIAVSLQSEYYSRLKSLESAFLKIEKERGKYANPFYEMDDMFAATIVVPTLPLVQVVREKVAKRFVVVEKPDRNPKPDEFSGNYDVHIILRLQDSPLRSDKSLLALPFELQVKTRLQHAWASVSHDTIYKARKLSYGLSRIANQIRALLELADTVLGNIEEAAKLQGEIDYQNFTDLQQIIDVMEQFWTEEFLPSDRRRAADIIKFYMQLANVNNADDLRNILSDSKYEFFLHLRSIPPTQAVFMILFMEGDGINKLTKGNSKIVLTEESLEFCPMLGGIPASNRILP